MGLFFMPSGYQLPLSYTVLYTLFPLQTNSGPGPFADFIHTLQTQHRNDFLCNIS